MRRRLGFCGSELRRRVDRVQWLLGIGLLVTFLAAAPPAAAWLGGWTYDNGVRSERHEAATRHRVVATVLASGGLDTTGSDRYIHQTVRTSWRGSDGRAHTSVIPAWKGAKPGAKRTIWVDDAGRVTVRPRPHSRTVADAIYIGGAAVLGVGVPLLIVYGLIRYRCDRHRDALWDADWARIDSPQIG